MKLSWFEGLLVNSPLRAWLQRKFEAPRLFQGLTLPSNALCLEIGCGRGVGALLIVRRFNCRLIAIDVDEKMIQKAKRYLYHKPNRAQGVNIGSIHLGIADASSLPFPDNTFDACFAFGVLHHISPWQRAVLEISRVLKEKGFFVFDELFLPHPVVVREGELFRCLQEAHLEVIAYHSYKPLGCIAKTQKGAID